MTEWQRSLFDLVDVPGVDPGFGGLEHWDLSGGAWLEYVPGWVRRHDLVFDSLVDTVPWRSERRPMYDRTVDVPRLVCFYGDEESLPHPVLVDAFAQIQGRYGSSSGGPVATASACLYRDGRDSVAWHGDRIGRGSTHDTLVAIVSLGQRRRLLLRPVAGGPSRRFELGAGDLLVMGGRSQQAWEHSVPKTVRPVGPRLSVQFRSVGAG